ncbi:RES family NAD+ phosphorylase [Agaribacterium haliotis]|uniref:RES family NAD+ phosphorylase n=1 Tax=Agaribacterium haliotis TaxID=2013869 RepID=UPI000BB58DB6|nr:RES family NAD+ phosphorylase [Agaribacterium haliotis]
MNSKQVQSIWQQCNGDRHFRQLKLKLYRLVESQEQVATLGYVDNLEEQALLEQLLEQNKPPLIDGCEQLHYLLSTPFRYPPLQWGSRFGQVHERSIFYAACDQSSCLSESAYYRFVFLFSMQGGLGELANVRSEHSMFSVNIATKRGIALELEPFSQHEADLAHPSDYSSSQALGTAMRASEVQAFTYISARSKERGRCAGLFTPSPFTSKKPAGTSSWICELNNSEVKFKQLGETKLWRFPLCDFLIDGQFPSPA